MSAKGRILTKITRNRTAWCRAIIDLLDNVLGAFRKTMKSDYYLRHVCLSVCLSSRTEQSGSLDEFSWKYLSKICRENASFITVRQSEYRQGTSLYRMQQTDTRLWSHRAQFCLEGNKMCRENQNTHFVLNTFYDLMRKNIL
jgi:hypothetical protein